jgi:hypothetical protein
VKFGGGFYCGKIEIEGKEPIYAFNGFFMAMRAKFVTPGTSIHYYVVEFDPATLSWKGKWTKRHNISSSFAPSSFFTCLEIP